MKKHHQNTMLASTSWMSTMPSQICAMHLQSIFFSIIAVLNAVSRVISIKPNRIKLIYICIAQNYNLKIISLGFDKLYSRDILCL